MLFGPRDRRRISEAVTGFEKQKHSSKRRTGKGLDTNRASVLVKTPSGGIPARSGTTLGKADCTIQDVDKSTDGLSDGGTLSVYNSSDSAVSGSVYISAIRDRTGNYFADISGSSTAVFASIKWTSSTQSTNSTAAVLDITIADGDTTDSTVFDISVGSNYCKLLKAGFYTVICPVFFSQASGNTHTSASTFDITDDGSTVRTFAHLFYVKLESKLAIADSSETSPWSNSDQIGYVKLPAEYRTEDTNTPTGGTQNWNQCKDWEFTHTKTFYLSQTEIDSLTGDAELKNMVQHQGRNTSGESFSYYRDDPGSTASEQWTELIYWGDGTTGDYTTVDMPAVTP